MDSDRFDKCCNKVLDRGAVTRDSIGLLAEKTVHSVLKEYFSESPECMEIKIGRYFADVCNPDGHIFEVQTKQFFKLRSKLIYFLSEHKVTIVYPVSFRNTVRWIDPQTGKMKDSPMRKYAHRRMNIFTELYGIRDLLDEEGLSIIVVLMETEEYRFLDGFGKEKKKRATKCDRFPKKLVDAIVIERKEDYKNFLPSGLPEAFTSKEFAKKCGCSVSTAQTALLILFEKGIVERIERKKEGYIYKANY